MNPVPNKGFENTLHTQSINIAWFTYITYKIEGFCLFVELMLLLFVNIHKKVITAISKHLLGSHHKIWQAVSSSNFLNLFPPKSRK